MTFCLTKSSEKSKNSLIRGGLLTQFFKISKFSLIRGGYLPEGFYFSIRCSHKRIKFTKTLERIFSFGQHQQQPRFRVWFALWTYLEHFPFVHAIPNYQHHSWQPSSLKTSLLLLWDVKNVKYCFHRRSTMRIMPALVFGGIDSKGRFKSNTADG